MRDPTPTLEDMVRNLDEAKRTMEDGADDLEEIRKRVEATNETLNTHINTVSNLRTYLYSNEKSAPTTSEHLLRRHQKRRISSSKNFIPNSKSYAKLPPMHHNKKPLQFNKGGNVKSYGKLPNLSGDGNMKDSNAGLRLKGITHKNGFGVLKDRDSFGNVVYCNMKPKPLMKKNKSKIVIDERKTKGKIMGKLINMAGRMNEFNEHLENQLKGIMLNGSNGLRSKLEHLNY
jgi:hypothetical protein